MSEIWRYRKDPDWKTGIIDDGDGNTIAEVYNHREEKAQELVRMANCYADLLEVRKTIQKKKGIKMTFQGALSAVQESGGEEFRHRVPVLFC